MKNVFRFMQKKFSPYVIQIGSNREVLYVNYAASIPQAVETFLYRHTHLRDSILRTDLFSQNLEFTSTKKADRSCRQLIRDLEAAGYEIIAGGPIHNNFWQTYVIEIDGNPEYLYVGETNYPVEKRFQQHVYKFNPARILLKYDSFELAMQHAEDWPKSTSKPESLKSEAALAEKLRAQGYKVEGGH